MVERTIAILGGMARWNTLNALTVVQ